MTTSKSSQEHGQKTKIKSSLSIKITTALMGLCHSIAKRLKRKKQSNLYRHCFDTPLSVFIEVLITGDLNLLIKSGKPSSLEISNAWENLFSEYCELVRAPRYVQVLNLSKEIGALTSKLLTIRACLSILAYRHSAKAVYILESFGYKANWSREDMNQLAKELESISTRSKSIEIALAQKKAEYDKLINEGSKNELTREKFASVLLDLSKFMGFQVKAEQVTVLEYTAMLKKYEQWVDAMTKEQQRKR